MNKAPKKDSGSWFANFFNGIVRTVSIAILAIIAIVVHHYFLSNIIKGRYLVWLVLIWILLAYGIVPRLYRLLSKLFVPNYFIGRTQAGDGMLGDPINLAFIGSDKDLKLAMQKAGWIEAKPLSLGSSFKMIYAAVLKKNYPDAPVSSLFLFNHKQDFAFEKDIDNNPRKRHHVRFWHVPDDWWLPGGFKTDWLAAATFDEHVELSLFTGQITHKIDSNVDQERDHVIGTLKKADQIKSEKVVEHFTSSYHGRNGGGDSIHTDGALPFIEL
jgi:hypothetical protein